MLCLMCINGRLNGDVRSLEIFFCNISLQGGWLWKKNNGPWVMGSIETDKGPRRQSVGRVLLGLADNQYSVV